MKYCWSTLRVKDFNKSLDFYKNILGLPLAFSHSTDNISIAMLGEKDLPKIELLYDGNSVISDGIGITIGFEVESLSESIDYLKAKGIDIARGPFSPNPDITFIFIKDPNGYEIQLVDKK